MKKWIFTVAIGLMAVVGLPSAAFAEGFMDSGVPERMITGGIRFGVNTSNQHGSLEGYSDRASYSWKTGFVVGGVVDLNVRNFFAIQPGFFFENRSFDYTVVRHDPAAYMLQNDLGHTRSYSFNVPVLLSFRFGLSQAVQWKVDFGPYFAFGLGGKDKMQQVRLELGAAGEYSDIPIERDYYGDGRWQHKKFDWGFKLGTGFRFFNHFVVDVYYMAGCKDVSAYKEWTMRNKSWNFSIGYDF